MWTLKETFALFQVEHPDVKIGLSKFSALRPANVLPQSSTPRQVCLCQYHDNIKLLCDSLNKKIPSFPQYSSAFINNLVCDTKDEVCMYSKCSKCPNWIDAIKKDAPLDDDIVWSQWERVSQPVESKKGKIKDVAKMLKVTNEGTVEEALSDLEDKMSFFLEHVFIKRKQHQFFEDRISQLGPEEAVVQVDFAENYTCCYQDEIQAAHWSQEQITLFTAAVWVNDSSKTTCETHCIISDDHGHDKWSVSVFLDTVINDFVAKKHPQVKRVDVFSDGPASQFKNKYMANFCCKLERHGLKVRWNFFATSHGKGVVDGVGGSVKRAVWTAVSTRKVIRVVSAEEFFDTARKFCKSVNVTLCLKEDISKAGKVLCLEECFKEAKAIAGIKSMHCIEPSPTKGKVLCRLYSSQPVKSNHDNISSDCESFHGDSTDVSIPEDPMSDGSQEADGNQASYVSIPEDPMSDGSQETDRNHAVSSDVEITDNVSRSADCTCTFADLCMQSTEELANDIHLGLPEEIRKCFDNSSNVNLHPSSSSLAQLIVNGSIEFGGDTLISLSDLKELDGKGDTDEEKWIPNFVIDSYLHLIKSECSPGQCKAEVLKWEEFEKVAVEKIKEKNLLQQDIILIPCNSGEGIGFCVPFCPKRSLS